MAADGPLGSDLVDRVEGACEPVLPLHSGGRGQSPRGGGDPGGSDTGRCNTPCKRWDGSSDDRSDAGFPVFLDVSEGAPVEPTFTRGDICSVVSPGSVTRRAVRAAVDWWVTHFALRVSEATYAGLVASAGGVVAGLVPSTGKFVDGVVSSSGNIVEIVERSSGEVLHLKVTHQRTRVVLQGDGIHLVVADPGVRRADQTGGQHGEHYGATLQYQGKLLSTGDTGLDVVRAVRPAIWALLYPGLTHAEVERYTRVGRMDFAVDVVHEGRDAALAIDAFYEGESATRVYSRFATHTSAGNTSQTLQILGDKTNGRTFYTGKSPLYRVYEREKHTGDGHWEVLLETLKRRGYDGVSPLLRCEVQVDRSNWMRGQTCDCERCKGRQLTEWTEDEAMAHVEGNARALFERCRHTEGNEDVAPKLRHSSPLWMAVLDGTAQLVDDGHPQVVAQLRCVQRKLLRERRLRTAANAIHDLVAVGLVDPTGPDGATTATPSEVLAAVMERVFDDLSTPEGIHRVLQRTERARYRAGLRPSKTLAASIENQHQDDPKFMRVLNDLHPDLEAA